jgi:hypothetical protein
MNKHIINIVTLSLTFVAFIGCGVNSSTLVGTAWISNVINEDGYEYQQIILFNEDNLELTTKLPDGTILATITCTYSIHDKNITIEGESGTINGSTITFGTIQFNKDSKNSL